MPGANLITRALHRPTGEPSYPAVVCPTAAVTRALLAAVEQLRAAYRARSKLPAAVRRAHLETLQTLVRDLTGGRANAATEPACVRRARQYIAEHLTEPLTAGMVAKHAGLCPQQFRKQFKGGTGLTFGRYLTLRRLERAQELLLDAERKVADVCFESGFQSLSPFYRAFRKHAGQPASDYRRKYR